MWAQWWSRLQALWLLLLHPPLQSTGSLAELRHRRTPAHDLWRQLPSRPVVNHYRQNLHPRAAAVPVALFWLWVIVCGDINQLMLLYKRCAATLLIAHLGIFCTAWIAEIAWTSIIG